MMCFRGINRDLRLFSVGWVISWLSLIGAISLGFLMCLAYGSVDHLVEAIQKQTNRTTPDVNLRIAVLVTAGVYFILSAFQVLTSVLLIMGIMMERHLLLIPWLISFYTFIIFNGVIFSYMIYVSVTVGLSMGLMLGTLVYIAIGSVLEYTLWNIVYSVFKEMRARRDQQQQPLLARNQLNPVTEYRGIVNNHSENI